MAKKSEGVQLGFRYGLTGLCHKSGRQLWHKSIENLVTTEGLTDLVDVYFNGDTQLTSWYLGVINSTGYSAVAASDTMASHGGWTELTTLYNTTRPVLSLSAAVAGSASNISNQAWFRANGTSSIQGVFVTSDNTLGGTTGTLFSAAALTTAVALEEYDTLLVDATITMTSG